MEAETERLQPMHESFLTRWTRVIKGTPRPKHTGTVYDIPDDKLLERAVRNARSREDRKGVKHPRWVAVMDSFSLGSTYAHQLCRRFDLDPDEQVAR